MVCNDCDMVYIGQTGRAFRQRFKEHLPKNNLKASKSKYAEHLMVHNYNYTDFDINCKPLHLCNKGRYMNAAEAVSYTHLDVYKRQVQLTGQDCSEGLKDSSAVHTTVSNDFPEIIHKSICVFQKHTNSHHQIIFSA